MEFLAQYNLTGIVIGVATFVIIGIFHPMVTKGEYSWVSRTSEGRKMTFLAAGAEEMGRTMFWMWSMG